MQIAVCATILTPLNVPFEIVWTRDVSRVHRHRSMMSIDQSLDIVHIEIECQLGRISNSHHI